MVLGQRTENRSDLIGPGALRRLHRVAIADSGEIRALFGKLREGRVPLRRGLNKRILAETAVISEITPDHLFLATDDFDSRHARQLFLSFEFDRRSYFFASTLIDGSAAGGLRIAWPREVFLAERRSADRTPGSEADAVELQLPTGARFRGHVADTSGLGMSVSLREPFDAPTSSSARVSFLSGVRAGQVWPAEVRHCRPDPHRSSWSQVGLLFSPTKRAVRVEEREQILHPSIQRKVSDRLAVAGAAVRVAVDTAATRLGWRKSAPPKVPVVDYVTKDGERIRAIVDAWGDCRAAVAVIVPPAFGKTKETLLPLASTILATFRKAEIPVVVVRFDGIRRRGESHNDPECLVPGREYLNYTGFQAVQDILATLDFVEKEYETGPAILVTFSAASSEGRKVTAMDRQGRVGGWISVVGAPDAQSAMKKISGGIDYTVGLLRGVRFGKQEVLGILMDADRVGLDAIEHGLASYEDAVRDMMEIDVPITWLHGKYDAWMDGERVRDLMSAGAAGDRKLIEIPTGHQLRNSAEAFDIFRLVAAEIAEMATGRRVEGVLPNLRALERRHRAERARLPRRDADLRSLWADYLLGRDRRLGIELMTSSALYKEFLDSQIDGLRLSPDSLVADLGAGTGSFSLAVRSMRDLSGVRVIAADLVREALVRGRDRERSRWGSSDRTLPAAVDLAGAGREALVPLRSASVDRALLSLVVSYLDEPEALLREAHRITVPGGRIVVSTLRKDADISKIYEDGVAELTQERMAELFGDELAGIDLGQLSRDFLNDGARILALEEQGVFRFWDVAELTGLLRDAGFDSVRVSEGLGTPPQALIACARRP